MIVKNTYSSIYAGSKCQRTQLEYAGLRNKNRGRDIDKRPFDARTMGREKSLLDTPKDVNADYSTKNYIGNRQKCSGHRRCWIE